MVMEGNMQLCIFISAHMLLPITYLLKNTDIAQRIVCHAQQWGKETQVGLWAPNLIHSIKAYAVCIRVKVAKPVNKHWLNNAKEMQLQ